jgi:hypothetical protein
MSVTQEKERKGVEKHAARKAIHAAELDVQVRIFKIFFYYFFNLIRIIC